MSRQISSYLARTPPTIEIVTGKITGLSGRTATVDVGAGAEVKMFCPSSLGTLGLNNKLYIINASGHLWPYALDA